MTISLIERGACPLCDHAESDLLCTIPFSRPDLRDFLDQFYTGRMPANALEGYNYRVVQCTACQFVYQDPVLNEDGMQALYGQWIDQAASLRKKQTTRAKLERKYSRQIAILASVLRDSPINVRILDFGMGWGYWSSVAQAQGYQVDGFELSTERCAHARALGVNAIEQLPEPGPHYQVIFANQVFEHLPKPRQTLETLRDRLVPGGIVYLRVPDGRGIPQQLKSDGWEPGMDAIHPLEHINCFTRKTLLQMASSVGLRPFNPPLRLEWRTLWGGIRREFADRFLTTHVFFRYDRRRI